MEVKEITCTDDGRPYLIELTNEDKNLTMRMKWDGCVDLRMYNNGDTYERYTADNIDYIHICNVKEFIEEMQSAFDIAKSKFDKNDFGDNWI